MMFCLKCGNTMDEEEKICPKCGNEAEAVPPDSAVSGQSADNPGGGAESAKPQQDFQNNYNYGQGNRPQQNYNNGWNIPQQPNFNGNYNRPQQGYSNNQNNYYGANPNNYPAQNYNAPPGYGYPAQKSFTEKAKQLTLIGDILIVAAVFMWLILRLFGYDEVGVIVCSVFIFLIAIAVFVMPLVNCTANAAKAKKLEGSTDIFNKTILRIVITSAHLLYSFIYLIFAIVSIV